jgi:hypothetical protein
MLYIKLETLPKISVPVLGKPKDTWNSSWTRKNPYLNWNRLSFGANREGSGLEHVKYGAWWNIGRHLMSICSQKINILYDSPLSVDVSGSWRQLNHIFVPLLRKMHKINRYSRGLCICVCHMLTDWMDFH